jgi:hypothetical protein
MGQYELGCALVIVGVLMMMISCIMIICGLCACGCLPWLCGCPMGCHCGCPVPKQSVISQQSQDMQLRTGEDREDMADHVEVSLMRKTTMLPEFAQMSILRGGGFESPREF